MLSPNQRIRVIEENITLKDNYDVELEQLRAIESELSTYRNLGCKTFVIEGAKYEIQRIRSWIIQETRNER